MSIVDLDKVRAQIVDWYTSLQVPGVPYGTYRFGPGLEPGFYASADMAILRWMIGEDLSALPEDARFEWCGVINSRQHPNGWYGPEMNHHVLHANGTATNALCALGGKYRYPVPFYTLFNTPERIGPWLSQIDWRNPWSASHLVWGGPVLWARSKRATDAWLEACFAWLSDELNEFGAWPKSFPTLHGGKIAPIGNAVHIWPIYRHRGLEVPGVDALAALTLETRREDGYWDGIGDYGTMDALYVLMVAGEQNGGLTQEMQDVLSEYITIHFADKAFDWACGSVHKMLGWASCIGYLQRALPHRFKSSVRWGDIFDLSEIYDLDAVDPTFAS